MAYDLYVVLLFLEVENPELPKVEIEIPSQLKLKLEDDCYFIKRKKKASITLYNLCDYYGHNSQTKKKYYNNILIDTPEDLSSQHHSFVLS